MATKGIRSVRAGTIALGVIISLFFGANQYASAAPLNRTTIIDGSKSTRWSEGGYRHNMTASFSATFFNSTTQRQIGMTGYFKADTARGDRFTNHQICVRARINIYAKATASQPAVLVASEYQEGQQFSDLGGQQIRSSGSKRNPTTYWVFPFEVTQCVGNSVVSTVSASQDLRPVEWESTDKTDIYRVEVITTAWNTYRGTNDVAYLSQIKKSKNV